MDAFGRTLANDDGHPNEDAFLIGRKNGKAFWAAVADGSGRAGGLATRLLHQMSSTIQPDILSAALGGLLKSLDAQLVGGPQSTLAMVLGRENMAILAWAGDSRILHLDNEGSLTLVSSSNNRLGSGVVVPGLALRSALPGSMFLLVSDGTWGGIGGMAGLHRALAQTRPHASDLPSIILQAASKHGRPDDMTCVVIIP
jgi:hypothetical protein